MLKKRTFWWNKKLIMAWPNQCLTWGLPKEKIKITQETIPSINADKVHEHERMVEKESWPGFSKYEDQMKPFYLILLFTYWYVFKILLISLQMHMYP